MFAGRTCHFIAFVTMRLRLEQIKWIFCLFQDLLNFDDPLNVEAADHYERDKVGTSEKQIWWIFDDNFGILFNISP